MKSLTVSTKVFGYYITATGAALAFAPDLLLSILQIESSANIWMQLLGIAFFALGYYYLNAAKDMNLDFIKNTIPVRMGQFPFVCAVLLMNDGPFVLAGISFVEFLFGVHALYLIRKHNATEAKASNSITNF